jgi:hypothetical protein
METIASTSFILSCLLFVSSSGTVFAGTPAVFSTIPGSQACDPVSCYQSTVTPAFDEGFSATDVSAFCRSGANPTAYGSIYVEGCYFDATLITSGGQGLPGYTARYYDDYYGLVIPDVIAAVGDEYLDVFGAIVDNYHMSTESDCYNDAISEDIPPPTAC